MTQDMVRVLEIWQDSKGRFVVRGTLDRSEVPVVLRQVADLQQDSGEQEG